MLQLFRNDLQLLPVKMRTGAPGITFLLNLLSSIDNEEPRRNFVT